MGGQRKFVRDTIRLVASIVLLHLCTNANAAALEAFNSFLFTENRGINSIGYSTGWRLQLGLSIYDPAGVPGNIASVIAQEITGSGPGGITLGPVEPLSFLDSGPVFSGYEILPLPDYEANPRTGMWAISATNNDGEFDATVTHRLDKPRRLPIAQNIAFSDSSTTSTVTWDPVFFDDDSNSKTPDVRVDGYVVRLLTDTGSQFFQSNFLSEETFSIPAGELVVGQDYAVRIRALNFDHFEPGSPLENASSAFVDFSPVPLPTSLLLMLSALGLAAGLCRGRHMDG